jgi:transposase
VAETDRVKLQLTPEALALLTDGIDLRGAHMLPWYERAVA